MELIDRVRAVVAAVRHEHVPDPRLAVFEVVAAERDGVLALGGAISDPAAAEALHRRIALLEDAREVRDEIERLPAALDDGPGHAVVRSPVAPMLAGPMVAEPQISQAVLGQHLVVLRRNGRWFQVRGEDGYLGWVHRGYLCRMSESDARGWRAGAAGEVHLSLGAEVRDESGQVIALLPWGARVHLRGDRVVLPEGAVGRATGSLVARSAQPTRFPARGEAICATAEGWIGAPYLWAGVTPSGVDCSGLVQAVFRMHGVELPRDSDQQARVGEELDAGSDLHRFAPGDLLFFAEEERRVSHVAISLGGSRVVHSALGNGGVRRNDLAGDSGLERELRRLLIAARRVIPLAG